MKLTKNSKILIGILVGLAVLFVIVMLTRTVLNNTSNSSKASDKVVVEDSTTGRKATFSRDGYVYFVDEDGNEHAIAWGNEKTSSFFDYITSNWKTGESGYLVSVNGQNGGISADDELIQTVLEELSDSDDGDGGSDGGGLSDLFSSPTPPSGGSGSSGGGGDSGGSGGSTLPPPAPSWCKHWKLSYCADPVYPSPSPTPSMSFPPEVIQAKDCDEWNAKVDTKTVISNFSCSVVAARFPISSNNKDIWINNNIVYAAYDNTNSLGLIAQHDIYFVRDIPNNFKIDGALMAQKGKIIRHGYYSSCGNSSYNVRDNLTINGSIISFEKSYWNYGTQPVSGFETRTINYDANLLYKPPPYFPTSGDYEFISWTEE